MGKFNLDTPKVWGERGNRIVDKNLLTNYLRRKTVELDSCWVFFGGSKTEDGYRRIMIDGRMIGVHRLSAYIFLGLDLDDDNQYANHKPECTDKTCWNPEHLYVGTHQQNQEDRRTEYCSKGHKKSWYKDLSRTYCKICNNASSRKTRMKHG